MAKSTTTLQSTRSPGRPKRDLVKTTISMNAEVFTLWDKLASKKRNTKIGTLETLILDECTRLGITVTPEEIQALTGLGLDEAA